MTSGRSPVRSDEVLSLFGKIDVYLFDQILRGRITPSMRLLDAGCGAGRNVEYLLRCGADVHGIDADAGRIEAVRGLARELVPGLPRENFRVGELTELPFDDACFDAVVCNAVLHFAKDERQFHAMLDELWRVLAPRGVFFSRLASDIGIEDLVIHLEGRRYTLPDGTDRFLVDHDTLLAATERLGGELLDPIKTTNVQDLRAMTTWVVGKPA